MGHGVALRESASRFAPREPSPRARRAPRGGTRSRASGRAKRGGLGAGVRSRRLAGARLDAQERVPPRAGARPSARRSASLRRALSRTHPFPSTPDRCGHWERDWLKQRRLPNGSVISLTRAPHGASEMPGFMFGLGREESSAGSASTSSMWMKAFAPGEPSPSCSVRCRMAESREIWR
jgi:hypothetical protein